jgi:hypothetical protein
MARYFFDFRSDGPLSADDEGLELLDADVAHQQAVGALVEGIRDIILEGAKDQRFAVEVRDDLGRVLQISAVLASEFSEAVIYQTRPIATRCTVSQRASVSHTSASTHYPWEVSHDSTSG